MAVLQTINVPLLAVNDTVLTVVDILSTNGNYVNKGDVILIFETSKTTYEVVAEHSGYIQLFCKVDEDYEVNTTVAQIYDTASEIVEDKSDSLYPQKGNEESKDNQGTNLQQHIQFSALPLFSEKALEKIREYKIQESAFVGKSFVTERDVLFLVEPTSVPTVNTIQSKFTEKKSELIIDDNKVELVKLPKVKMKEIEFLSSVQRAGLISTISIFVEVGHIFTQLNKSFSYFKDSILPLIVYETGRLLEAFKELNAYYAGENIAFYKFINIGFAIDLDKGLKVLKIPNPQTKTLQQIESDIFKLSEKYVDDQIALDDLSDITFTITDLSAEGVNSFIPLVNFMNASILGINAVDDKLNRINLNLTFDHRVTEGKLVAKFLNELKTRIESYTMANDNIDPDLSCFKCHKTIKEDMSEIGFVKVLTSKGREEYVCQACLKGF